MNRTKRVSKKATRSESTSTRTKVGKKASNLGSLSGIRGHSSTSSNIKLKPYQFTRGVSFSRSRPSKASIAQRRSFSQSRMDGLSTDEFPSFSWKETSLAPLPSTSASSPSHMNTSIRLPVASLPPAAQLMTISRRGFMTNPYKVSHFANVNMTKPTLVRPSLPVVAIQKRFGHGLGYSHYTDANEVQDRILFLLRSLPTVNQDKITPKAHFRDDLGLDSLSQVELVIMMEQEFEVDINDNDAARIQTVEEAIHYFAHTPYVV